MKEVKERRMQWSVSSLSLAGSTEIGEEMKSLGYHEFETHVRLPCALRPEMRCENEI